MALFKNKLRLGLIVLLLIVFRTNNYAQNLVLNHSFENIDSCDVGTGHIEIARPWYQPTQGASEIFHQCHSGIFGVPNNLKGFQIERDSSNAYAGFRLFDFNLGDYREYISARLASPLIDRSKYCVAFYVNLSNVSLYAIDSIGIYFSTDSITVVSDSTLPFFPQIINGSDTFLRDTIDWRLVVDTFTSDSSYSFITIGNFKDDSATNTDSVDTIFPFIEQAYYYIDDISIVRMPDVDLGDDTILCAGSTVSLDALRKDTSAIDSLLLDTNYRFKWSTGATTRTILVDTTGQYSVSVTNILCDTNNYQIRDTIQILILSSTNFVDDTLCSGDSIILDAGNRGVSYIWSTGSTTQTIDVDTTGQYWVKIFHNNCDTINDTIDILFESLVASANAGSDTSLCNDATMILDGNPTAGVETGLWTIIDGIGTIADSNSEKSAVSGLTIGDTTVMEWKIISPSGVCISRDTMEIRIDSVITEADAGSDTSLCNDATMILDGNPTAGVETGLWTIIDGIGTIADSSNEKSAVSGLTIGDTTVMEWKIISPNGVCISRDTMEIRIDSTVTEADAGSDINLCNRTAYILGGNPADSNEKGIWSNIEGTVIFSDSTDEKSEIIGLIVGDTTVLEWRILSSNGVCGTRDTMEIRIDSNVTQADAGLDKSLCNITIDTLLANPAMDNEIGMWTRLSGSGVIEDLFNENSSVFNLSTEENNSFIWKITSKNGACESMDTITIMVNALPEIELIQDTFICLGQTVLLDAGLSDASYQWSTGDTTQSITVMFEDTIVVEVTDTNGCIGRDSVAIIMVPPEENIAVIYPNPSNGFVFIKINLEEPNDVEVSLFNIVGHKLERHCFDNRPIGLNVLHVVFQNQLGEGCYLVEIKAGDTYFDSQPVPRGLAKPQDIPIYNNLFIYKN